MISATQIIISYTVDFAIICPPLSKRECYPLPINFAWNRSAQSSVLGVHNCSLGRHRLTETRRVSSHCTWAAMQLRDDASLFGTHDVLHHQKQSCRGLASNQEKVEVWSFCVSHDLSSCSKGRADSVPVWKVWQFHDLEKGVERAFSLCSQVVDAYPLSRQPFPPCVTMDRGSTCSDHFGRSLSVDGNLKMTFEH